MTDPAQRIPDPEAGPLAEEVRVLAAADQLAACPPAGDVPYYENDLPPDWQEPWPWTRWAVPLTLIVGVPIVVALVAWGLARIFCGR